MKSLVTVEDITPYLAAFGGDPLTLKLFADEAILLRTGLSRDQLLTIMADASRQRSEALKQGLAEEEADNLSISTLRNYLFELLFNRLPAKDAIIARTLAFMTDLKFNPFILRGDREWETLLPQWIAQLNPSYTPSDITASLLALGQRGILRPGTMRFKYDPLHKHLMEKHQTPDVRADLHTQISKLFAENHLSAFDVWHQLRAAMGSDGKTDTKKLNIAFRALYIDTLALEAEERNLELLQLYQEFRKRLWKQQDWQWAFVQIKLAGILYTGFDLTDSTDIAEFEGKDIPIQNEGELNRSGLEFFKNNPNLLKAPDSDAKFCSILHNTYAQGRLLPPIHAFENSESMIFDKELRPTDKGERQNVALAKSIRKARKDFKKFEILPSKPLLAHFYNFQGCFFNGGGKFAAAVSAYKCADAVLRAYQEEIALQGIELKTHQEMQFREDYLDIANNWSRTRFLQYGPQAALDGSAFSSSPLARFEEMVKKETKINDKYSYAYSLIDLCYYYMALNGDALREMRSCLNSAYKSSTCPASLPAKDSDRRVNDHWTEAYFDALEAAYKFYREDGQDSGKIHATIDLLTQSGDRFAWDNFGYARDYLMIHCNIPLLKMAATTDVGVRRALVPEFKAALEREIETKKNVYKTRTILDEPIVKDFLLYLEACAAAPNGVPADDGSGAIAATKRRFPGLLGDKCPTFLDAAWKPPILLRGALQMVTVTHTPQPWELEPLLEVKTGKEQ